MSDDVYERHHYQMMYDDAVNDNIGLQRRVDELTRCLKLSVEMLKEADRYMYNDTIGSEVGDRLGISQFVIDAEVLATAWDERE